MEIKVNGYRVIVECGTFGWDGFVSDIGKFRAATLSDLIELIKLTTERINYGCKANNN